MSDSIPDKPPSVASDPGFMVRAVRHVYSMPHLLLTITTLAWAGNTVLAKGVVDLLPPVTLAFWRWSVALILLAPFAWPYLKKDRREIFKSWLPLTGISISGVSCYNTFLYIGVQTTTAVNSGLILATGPAAIVVLSRLVLKTRISGIQFYGLTLSFLGVVLIIANGSLETLTSLVFVRGDFWVIGSVMSSAVFSVLLHFRPRIHPMSFVFTTFMLGLLFLTPLFLWEHSRSAPIPVTGRIVASIAYVAIAPSIIAFFCWNRGIELIGASRAGLFLYLTPLFVAVMASLFLGEVLYWYHYAGMLLIFGGVFLFNRKRVVSAK